MNVLYEGEIFQILRCGGIARYFSEIIQRLPSDCRATIVAPNGMRTLGDTQARYVSVSTTPMLKSLRSLMRKGFQRRIASTFDSIPADVEHWTYYNGLCRRPIRRADRPLVVTVHDFIHEAFPDLDPTGDHVRIKQAAIRAADHLACVSQTTYDELCERYPLARGKSSVISHGTSLASVHPDPLPASLNQKPFVLFVGRRDRYKNFDLVWHAWQRLRGTRSDESRLVIVGPAMKRREAAALGWNPHDPSVVLMPHVSDSTLKTLYQRCNGFIFPSKAEGFGLPSLEALSAGAPVMVSDIPVMHEVVGDCGYYFDPNDENEAAQLMRLALENRLPDRQRKHDEGLHRAAGFSWQVCAQKTANLYRSLAA